MPYDPNLGKYKARPAWLDLLLKIKAFRIPGQKNIPAQVLGPNEPGGKISEARDGRKRIGKLKLNKETLRTLAIQQRANKNLEIMKKQGDPLRNGKKGLDLAMTASCPEVSACPQCWGGEGGQRDDDHQYKGGHFVKGVPEDNQTFYSDNFLCSLGDACYKDYQSADPYGDLCVTARGGGAGGDLRGC